MRISFRAYAPLALGLLTACTSSTSESGGGGGGSGDVTVQFGSPASATTENDTPWGAVVVLSDTSSEDIDLNFFWSGTALEFSDYAITTIPPVTIPAGTQNVTLVLSIFEDTLGELDEQVTLTLVKPVNAILGGITKHTVTIFDEDQVVFPEVEPNEDHLTANDVGAIGPGVSWEITGQSLVGAFDVFKLTASDDAAVHISLDPASAISEIVLNILDQDGNVLGTLDDDQPGTTLNTIFNVTAGQVFFLAVTVEVAGTAYVLDTIGV